MRRSPSRNESNPLIIMLQKMKLLLLYESDNPLERALEAQRLFSLFNNIFKSSTTGLIFLYPIHRGLGGGEVLEGQLVFCAATQIRLDEKVAIS